MNQPLPCDIKAMVYDDHGNFVKMVRFCFLFLCIKADGKHQFLKMLINVVESYNVRDSQNAGNCPTSRHLLPTSQFRSEVQDGLAS